MLFTKTFYTQLVNNKTYKIYWAGILVSLFFIATLISCSEKKTVWASVDKIELLEDDAIVLMESLGYQSNNKTDQKEFINKWIEQQLYIREMERSYPDKAQLMLLKSEWSKGDLARYFLEEGRIREELDTKISDSLVQLYYEQHSNEYSLSDYIVRALYLKIPKAAPDQDKLKELYLLKKNKDFSKIVSYANKYAENFYYNDSAWVYFDELTKDAPVENFNKDNVVLNRTKTYFSDDNYTYYLNIIDYKLKNEAPPFDFLKPIIKQALINQKLSNLKQKENASLIQTIRKKHEVISKY
ncbi:MAG: hypothetical protein M9916_10820 [Crocinitomicaceae bacterium]|nr:hypothetical protein [Crocinitomicaceae bacterium]